MTHSSNKNKSINNKNDSDKKSIKKKKRKLPPVNGTATPSEVFHRNLVDAVSNVEDSDEYEQYVYPYSHHEQMMPSTVTQDVKYKKQQQRHRFPILSNFKRPTTPSTSTLSLKHQESKGFINDLLHHQQQRSASLYLPNHHQHHYGSKKSKSFHQQSQQQKKQHDYQQDEGSEDMDVYHHRNNAWVKRSRPKLRSHIMEHPGNSHSNYHHHDLYTAQPWRHEGGGGSSSDDGYDDHHSSRYSEHVYLIRQHPKYTQYSIDVDDDDDGNNGYSSVNISCCRLLRYIVLCMFLLLFSMFLFIGYRAVPLKNISSTMGNVLASDKELIFDLMLKANNWNWWTIRIQQADLSVFAFSQLVPLQQQLNNNNNDMITTMTKEVNKTKKDDKNHTTIMTPAELLGNCQYFDQPLSFMSSGFFNGENEKKQLVNASTQIRIKSPGLDASGNQRWSRMIRYPYGLVNRGVIKYHPFPFFPFSSLQSISLCIVFHVDPISKTITSNQVINETSEDHGYCSHYSVVKK
ncbi:hypothetical protein BJ944DRAFT_272836 [Cunninghamella echinulata]|nr:hypothetical protein BJ944DRAFT_272836 [Cunninghamella echinulata]